MWVFILAPLVMLVSVTPTFAADFPNVSYHRCYYGDTMYEQEAISSTLGYVSYVRSG